MVKKKKKWKVVFSEQVKEQMKKMTPEVKKAFDEAVKKLQKNPYIGKPLYTKEEIKEIKKEIEEEKEKTRYIG